MDEVLSAEQVNIKIQSTERNINMLKKIKKNKRKIDEMSLGRNDEEKENYPEEDADDFAQYATLQAAERRRLAFMPQAHQDGSRERNRQQQNTHHESDMGFSDIEDVTPPNLVTGFVVANIGNMTNGGANNNVNSPDTIPCA